MRRRVLILNGPNSSTTAQRFAGIHGKQSLDAVNKQILEKARELSLECEFFQSNCEGELIDQIQRFNNNEFDAGIINSGAYAYYSYSLRDAIESIHKPFIEVHMSNIFSREEFRKTSVIAPVCAGQISGFGKTSYLLALIAIKELI